MRNTFVSSLYVGLMGIVVTVTVAGWQTLRSADLPAIILLIGAILAVSVIVFMLDRATQQIRIAPNIIVAVAIIGMIVGMQYTKDIFTIQVIAYALVGFAIGTVVGLVGAMTHTLPLLLPPALFFAVILPALSSWLNLDVPAGAMWHLIIVSVIPLGVLSSLAPTRQIAASGYTSAFVLLLAGLWVWPLTALAHAYGDWRIPPWTVGVEVAGATLLLAVAHLFNRGLLDQLWLAPMVERQFMTRHLRQLLSQFNSNQLPELEQMYNHFDQTWRHSILKKTVSIDTLDGWAQIIKYHQTSLLGRVALPTLTATAQAEDCSAEVWSRVVAILSDTFQTAKASVSAEALRSLVTLDPMLVAPEALWIATHGNEGHVKALLQLADDVAYIAAISALVGACQFDDALSNQQATRIWLWLQKYHPTTSIPRISVALNGLALINEEKTLAELQHNIKDWPIPAVRMALGRPTSPLKSLLWQWVSSSNQAQSAAGINLIDQILSH